MEQLTPHPPPPPILTSATTPTLSLCAGPWLTRRSEGSGLEQQTPSQMEGCPEELMPERRKRPRDPSDVPQIFHGGRGYTVYRIFNSRREGVMHRLMYDEGTDQCINKCDENRNMRVSHLSHKPRRKLKRGTLSFKPVVFLSTVFVLLLFLKIWRWTDTESDFYLRLKARRQNKLRGVAQGRGTIR